MHLSPTEYHRYLLSRTAQSLAYTGGGVRQWQNRLRRTLLQLLGDMPEKRCALRPKSI